MDSVESEEKRLEGVRGALLPRGIAQQDSLLSSSLSLDPWGGNQNVLVRRRALRSPYVFTVVGSTEVTQGVLSCRDAGSGVLAELRS